MKISEFISELTEIQTKHGDVEVLVFDSEETEDGETTTSPAYFALQENDENKVTAVTICDKETVLAFL